MSLIKLRFRTRLLVTYLFVSLLPLTALGIFFYFAGLHILQDLSGGQALETLRKTNEITDYKLRRIRDESLNLVTDKTVFQIFSQLNPDKDSSLLAADRSISALLQKRFSEIDDLAAVNIVTSHYVFGRNGLPGDPFKKPIETIAVNMGGRMQWIPTYDISDMYNDKDLQLIDKNERYLFSAVMQLNINYVENGIIHLPRPSLELPVLIVSYPERYFRDLLQRTIPLSNSYFVISPEGDVVSSSDPKRLATKISDDWANYAVEHKSGTKQTRVADRNVVMVYDTSAVTGWTTVAFIPAGELVKDIVPLILNAMLTIGLMLLGVSVLLAIVVSGQLARPMKALMAAIKQVGIGNFGSKITLDKDREFGVLFNRFNDMNGQIQTLIDENYASKLREKEAEIMTLNVQLNPHFLYNTLNVMNWIAIDNDQKQLSKMLVSLSNMLYYTTQNTKETGDLQEEIGWLKNYLFIMSERFEGKFEVRFEIADELYSRQVPRLFLHPVVENAIIHGFGSMEQGGEIDIRGFRENGRRVFVVTDNGRGMDERLVERIMSPDSTHHGLRNVHTRIQLLYGSEYGVSVRSVIGEWTEVRILLPDTEIE